MSAEIVYEEKFFRSLNVLRHVLYLAEKPLEESQIIAIFQKLQYEAGFPIYHVYRKMGYLRSPTIEEDIDALKANGEILEKKGSTMYRLTEKGKAEAKKSPMPEEPLSMLKEIVSEIKDLSYEKARELCEKLYQSQRR